MLRQLYCARAYSELASELARLLRRHRRWSVGVQVGLALAVGVPVALGAAGVTHPLMLYSSGAGLVGLVALEAAASF